MASRITPSSLLPPELIYSKRMKVVLAMAINTSVLRTPASLLKEIPPYIIDAFLTIPPRDSRNFWKWEHSGEGKLAVPFETDEEMKDISRRLETSRLAYKKFYFGGRYSRLSMISIFGTIEDIEFTIGRWGSKTGAIDSSSDYSDGEDPESESEDDDEPRRDDNYEMIFVVNSSLGLSFLQLAEEVATAALGLYRAVHDLEKERNKHYEEWEKYGKIDDAYVAKMNAQMNVLQKECQFLHIPVSTTVLQKNGKNHTSIMGLFGQKSVLKPLVRPLGKL